MPKKIFVSHASADYDDYVEKFVDCVLRLGCGLDDSNLFFSSERSTGVPAGHDLMNTVRKEVEGAVLVIAIVTPMYQSRPVCVAELGAAWGRTGVLFPLRDPDFPRVEIEGVLPPTLLLPIDDSDVLDELSDKIKEVLGIDFNNAKWGAGKQKWLKALANRTTPLEVPDLPTEAQWKAVQKALEETGSALDYTESELAEAKRKLAALAETNDADERREILLPTGKRERFFALLGEARDALGAVPPIVQEALYRSLIGGFVTYPNAFDDPDGVKAMDDAVQRRLLVDEEEGHFTPNPDKKKVGIASGAIAELREFIDPANSGHEFAEWFESKYDDVEPVLADRDCWDALMDV